MSLEALISEKNSWEDKKLELETNLELLENAHTKYSEVLYTGAWSEMMTGFDTFRRTVNPGFKVEDWEGNRVENYRDQLDDLQNLLYGEEGTHESVLAKMETQIFLCQEDIRLAQENIDRLQAEIDAWEEEEEDEKWEMTQMQQQM